MGEGQTMNQKNRWFLRITGINPINWVFFSPYYWLIRPKQPGSYPTKVTMAPMGSPDSPRIDAPKAPAMRRDRRIASKKTGRPILIHPKSQGSSSNHHRNRSKSQGSSSSIKDPRWPKYHHHVSTTIETLGVHRTSGPGDQPLSCRKNTQKTTSLW